MPPRVPELKRAYAVVSAWMSLERKHRTEIRGKVHRASRPMFYCIFRHAFSDLLHDKSFGGHVEPAQFGNDVMNDAFPCKRQRALFDDLRRLRPLHCAPLRR